MKSFRHSSAALFLFVSAIPRRVLAFPLSYAPAGTAGTYIPLIVISISLFFVVFVFLAIKLVYMEQRRIRTIHAPPGTTTRSIPTSSSLSSSASSFGIRDKRKDRHRGLLVGFLGSPAWETSLTSELDRATWRRERRREYQLHTDSTTRSTRSGSARSKSKSSTMGSRLTKSTVLTRYSGDADRLLLTSSSGPSRIPTARGSSSSKAFGSVQRHASTNCHSRYGDFGEFHGARSAGGGLPQATRRASPSSIRLVDGPSHSNQVEYSFLSGVPSNAIVVSPLMGTRDSFQLSRCSLKCNRKPVPPLPPLPLFLPFHLPKDPETLESRPPQAREYLPSLRFSPLASVAKVFYSQQQALEEKAPSSLITDPDGSKHVGSRVPSSILSKTPIVGNGGPWTSTASVVQQTPPLHPRRKNVKSNHKRSQSCKGLAIAGSLSRTTLLDDNTAIALLSLLPEDKRCSDIEWMHTGVLRTPSVSSRNGSSMSKKPLKSCLRQNSTPVVGSPDFTLTPSTSETSTRTSTLCKRRSTGDQGSLRTPISDVDIGILGLDRFRWNEDDVKELKVRSCHMKKDSVALVPVWE